MLRIAEEHVRPVSRFEIGGAIVGTIVVGVAGVWLTGDARAFGAVIALVGLVVGVALGREEWRASDVARGGDVGPHASGDTDMRRAA